MKICPSCGHPEPCPFVTDRPAPAPCSPVLAYLAIPYSHPDPAVREARFLAVNIVAARLMSQGLHIFSPISHTHPIAIAGDLPRGWEYWQAYDRVMLAACKKLIVLKLDGWEESVGVAGEIAIAQEMGIEIEYLENSQLNKPRRDNDPKESAPKLP